jgi:hypothetical protein
MRALETTSRADDTRPACYFLLGFSGSGVPPSQSDRARGPQLFRWDALAAGILLTISTIGPVYGEPPELVTDRPDQTESSATVLPGLVQIEMGWTREGDEEDGTGTRSDALPGSLVRIGVTRRMELRLGHAGHNWERIGAGGPGLESEGLGDSEVGLKMKLRDEGPSWRPDVALIIATTLPTGDDEQSSGRADPSFRFALAHTLSERASLGYNAGVAWGTLVGPAGEKETEAVLEYTATVGFALAERLGCFAEFFGIAPLTEGAPDAGVSWDGGATILLLPNLQFDLAGGVGLTDDAADWFFGLGVSARLPR